MGSLGSSQGDSSITFIILHIMAEGSLSLSHFLSRHILKEFDIVLTLFCKCGVGFYFCK